MRTLFSGKIPKEDLVKSGVMRKCDAEAIADLKIGGIVFELKPYGWFEPLIFQGVEPIKVAKYQAVHMQLERPNNSRHRLSVRVDEIVGPAGNIYFLTSLAGLLVRCLDKRSTQPDSTNE